jgi:putative two-component system response regulator
LNQILSLNLKPTVLIIDDSPDVINLVSGLLKNSYKVKAATSGEKGLTIAQNDNSIDLILLDIMMAGLSGFEVCEQLKANTNTSDIPVIFITAMSNPDDELQGLKLGAVDYITKPISPAILLARVDNYLKIKAANDFLKDKSEFIEAQVTKRSAQLTAIHDIAILVLTALAETVDNEIDKSVQLNTFYVKTLAKHLEKHPSFKDFLTEKAIQMTHEGRSTYFDPDITDTFTALAESFREIAQRYLDNNNLAFKTNILKQT